MMNQITLVREASAPYLPKLPMQVRKGFLIHY